MASVKDFLNARALQDAKASGGSYVRLEEGDYVLLVESARFERDRPKSKTKLGSMAFKVGAKIVWTDSTHPTMLPGKVVDSYVGNEDNDMFLPNVRQVVDALFGIFGITKEQIDAMPEAEFMKMLDDSFMENQEAAGNYIFARVVDSGKPNPKTPGKNYINPKFMTPTREALEAAGVEIQESWVGIV